MKNLQFQCRHALVLKDLNTPGIFGILTALSFLIDESWHKILILKNDVIPRECFLQASKKLDPL